MALRTPAADVSTDVNLRHDLLANVHTLLGAVELLLTTPLTARQRRYINVCRRSAETLTGLSRKVPAEMEERTFERVAIDDLSELGVMYLPKPVTRSQLIEAVRGVGGGKRLRILAADDSPEACALLDQFLKSTARRVDIVHDGLSALQRYQHGKYDLLIIDLDMPVMDGRTAVRKIRTWEIDHNRHHIPVIVLTAHDLIEREAERPVSLVELDGGGEEIVHEPDPEIAHLVAGFLSGCRRDVQTILRAMTDSNYEVIGTVGRLLKGQGVSYGFARVTAIGGRLEDGAIRQDFNQIREAVRELSRYLDRVRIGPPARSPEDDSPLPLEAGL